jgi:tripartite-type tricarboxylate transporter receptor subunit TctC
MIEFLSDYEVSAWFGVDAPKNTPTEIVDMLNEKINAGLADVTIKAQFAALGAAVFVEPPTEFENFLAEEAANWAEVIIVVGIKSE